MSDQFSDYYDSAGPAQVFCLAEYLCDEMTERNWTVDDVAVRMLTSRGPVRDAFIVAVLLAVHKDTLVIDEETFSGLSRAFGVSQRFFKNLDATWRKWPDRRSPFKAPESIFGEIIRNSLVSDVAKERE